MKKFFWFISNRRIAETYYHELIDDKRVVFIYKDNVYQNKIFSKLFRIAFSQVVNSKIRIPFKKKLFEKLLVLYKVENRDDIVLIFHEGWFDPDISRLLKQKYEKVSSILYFDDTVETYAKAIPSLKPLELKNQYEYIFAYNPQDADKYGFLKCNACFSKLDISPFEKIASDLCFIGQPKDRYNLLKSISSFLEDKCRCDFIVVGDDEGKDGAIALTKEYMTYEQYLQHEVSSNCILELLKSDTQGATFRCWEAVYYNKRLLTNWKGIFSFPYYNSRFMRYFEKPEDIDIDFIKSSEPVDYCYKGENSPKQFLNNIESIIERNKNG